MPGDLLDLILIVLVVAFAVAGYRQGFIIGILSFAGFIGGGAVGAVFGPHVARSLVDGVAQQALVAIIVVFIAAMIGQLLASGLGVAMRSRLTWRPATVVDAVGSPTSAGCWPAGHTRRSSALSARRARCRSRRRTTVSFPPGGYCGPRPASSRSPASRRAARGGSRARASSSRLTT